MPFEMSSELIDLKLDVPQTRLLLENKGILCILFGFGCGVPISHRWFALGLGWGRFALGVLGGGLLLLLLLLLLLGREARGGIKI
jgi:hypothetical protein